MKTSFRCVILICFSFFLFGCRSAFDGTETLKIDSIPRGVNVSVDGVPVGKTPCTITMKKGKLLSPRIVLSARNYANTCIEGGRLNTGILEPNLKFDEIVVPMLKKGELTLALYDGELLVLNDDPATRVQLMALINELDRWLSDGKPTFIGVGSGMHLLNVEFLSDGSVKNVSVEWSKELKAWKGFVKLPEDSLPEEIRRKIKSFVASEIIHQIFPGRLFLCIYASIEE